MYGWKILSEKIKIIFRFDNKTREREKKMDFFVWVKNPI